MKTEQATKQELLERNYKLLWEATRAIVELEGEGRVYQLGLPPEVKRGIDRIRADRELYRMSLKPVSEGKV